MRCVRAKDAMADVAVADDKDSNDEHSNAKGTRPSLQQEPQYVQNHNKKLVLQHQWTSWFGQKEDWKKPLETIHGPVNDECDTDGRTDTQTRYNFKLLLQMLARSILQAREGTRKH